ncbi:PHD-finger [Popillia japonica]|uniref:PHD-finger n=1 Tax=Popillia japonica TaxID=7064 RepID=A0AAW1LAE2_POPJA
MTLTKCFKCGDGLPEEGDFIYCHGCEEGYHFKCSISSSTYNAMSNKRKITWRCETCRDGRKADEYEAESQKSASQSGIKQQEIMEIKGMLRNLQNKIDGIVKSQQFISAKYDEIKSGQDKIEKQLKKFDETINRLISQDKIKEAKFEELSDRIAELEKRDSETKIEIHGLEELAEDNLGETVVKLIEKLDVNVDVSEIDLVERMKSKQTGKPRPIVVRFKTVRACNAVKAKKRAVLTNQDITGARSL